MCHLQSSSAGTTTWTEQAIHPEARKASSGPPFRQCLAQKYRYAGTLGEEGKYRYILRMRTSPVDDRKADGAGRQRVA
jgi:hypothetical protein